MTTASIPFFDDRTEELLLRYVEGSLSDDDAQEFSRLLHQQPELAAEASKLQHFEQFLTQAQLQQSEEERVDTAFLLSMQQRLAQAISTGSVLHSHLDNAQNVHQQGTKTPSSSEPASTAPQYADDNSNSSSAPDNAPKNVSDAMPSSHSPATTGSTAKPISGIEWHANSSLLHSSSAILGNSLAVKISLAVVFVATTVLGVWKYVTEEPSDMLPFGLPTSSEQNGTLPRSGQQQPTTKKSSQERSNQEKNQRTPQQQAQKSSSHPASQKQQVSSNQSSASEALMPQKNQGSSQTLVNETPYESTPESKTTSKAESNAESRVSIHSTATEQNKTQRTLEELARQARTKEQSGDRLGAAFALKQLAIVQRGAGLNIESAASLARALSIAQSLNVRELEGEIIGEQAKLAIKQGEYEQARTALRRAIDILSGQNAASTSRWKRELQHLESKLESDK